jgi:hypothetical protein
MGLTFIRGCLLFKIYSYSAVSIKDFATDFPKTGFFNKKSACILNCEQMRSFLVGHEVSFVCVCVCVCVCVMCVVFA